MTSARLAAGELLLDWLTSHGLSQAAAARTLGVTAPCVHDWIRGSRTPQPPYRDAIARWTAGAVSSDVWLAPDERRELDRLRQIQPYAPSPEDDAG